MGPDVGPSVVGPMVDGDALGNDDGRRVGDVADDGFRVGSAEGLCVTEGR